MTRRRLFAAFAALSTLTTACSGGDAASPDAPSGTIEISTAGPSPAPTRPRTPTTAATSCGYTLAQFTAVVGGGWRAGNSGVPALCDFVRGTVTVAVARLPRSPANGARLVHTVNDVCDDGADYVVGGRSGTTGTFICAGVVTVVGATYRDGVVISVMGSRGGLAPLTADERRELVVATRKLIGG